MTNALVFDGANDMACKCGCRFALLKYLEVYNLNPPDNIAVLVYTDEPALFENFIPFFKSFHINELIKEKPQNDKQQAVSRLHFLQRAADRIDGNLLFLDKGFYTEGSLQDIFSSLENGMFYLQQAEQNSSDSNASQKWRKLQKEHPYFKKQTTQYLMPVWQGGVVGLNTLHRHVLNDAVTFAKTFEQQWPPEMLASLALGYHFQQIGTVQTCSGEIRSYLHLKTFDQLLQTFFRKNEEESIPNLIKKLQYLDVDKISKDQQAYEALPVYKRWLQTLTRKNWNIKQYEKKI